MTLLLLNLVDNAVKYGGNGPIVVRLRVAERGKASCSA
jgi:signal transduction histidine kinase